MKTRFRFVLKENRSDVGVEYISCKSQFIQRLFIYLFIHDKEEMHGVLQDNLFILVQSTKFSLVDEANAL